MKKHNILKYAVALCLSAFCLLFFPITSNAEEIRDEKNGVTYQNEIYISSGSASFGANGGGGAITVRLSNSDDRITTVKSKSKNLLAQVTAENYQTQISKDKTSTLYNETTISFFGKKKGSYKVTFKVVDANGKKKCTKTVKVHVDKYPTYSSETGIKAVTYAGKDINSYYPFTTVKKGKLKVTMKKGYKINSIYVKKMNSKGKWVSTKVKNKSKITLSKREKYTIKEEWGTTYVNALFPVTYIEIAVKNKKTKDVTTHVYSLYTINKK